MSWPASPPYPLATLRAQLNACAAWVAAGGELGDIHFPDADGDFSDPEAILRHEPGEARRPGYGMQPLRTGTLEIQLNISGDVATAEKLAGDIADEILTDTGLAGLRVQSIEPAAQVPLSESETGDDTPMVTAVVIRLAYGLEISS